MRTGAIVCLIIFILGAGLALIQLWFSPFDGDTFFKLILSLGIMFVVALGITLVRREYIEDKDLKKKGYID